jgi:hypothetical protein
MMAEVSDITPERVRRVESKIDKILEVLTDFKQELNS